MAVVGPFIQLAYCIFAVCTGDTSATLPYVAALTALELGMLFAWYRRTAEHYLGVGPAHFLLLPLGSLTVSLLYIHSAYLVLSKTKVSWKGRQYMVNTSKSIDHGQSNGQISSVDSIEFVPAAPSEPSK